MGDYILDFRPHHRRSNNAERLRFYPDMAVDRMERDAFTLLVSRTGGEHLWAPFESSEGVVVALAGQVALTSAEWQSATATQGAGGLACKAIYQAYRRLGIRELSRYSGAFAIHLYDPAQAAYHLVTDCAGTLPCYTSGNGDELLCSHPDVLAGLPGTEADASADWDLTSMAEFISTGVVSFPHSYYRRIYSLEPASVHTFTFHADAPKKLRRQSFRHTRWQVETLTEESEDHIAERLAAAITDASRRRTLPILGKTAVALSGGLDSRSILCAAERHEKLFAFCAFDEENAEFAYAKAIAVALEVPLVPFQRAFDHYGDHAEMGVRITGGMGELVSNHFLGFRQKLLELGVDNLVTGCYFDYLFKSIGLDAGEAGILRRERFRPFSFQSYLPHFPLNAPYAAAVRARLEALHPQEDRSSPTPESRARAAARRTFPLYHEGDNAQRLVPLRVMTWSPPATDPELIALSLAMPPEMKLDKRVFKKSVQRVCGPAISAIPDGNTGLPIPAGPIKVALNRYRMALWRRLEKRRKRLATAESWPNWTHYIRSSDKLRVLWQRPNPVARELIGELSGEMFRDDIAGYCDRPTQYFMRLLTLKLWLDQRTRAD